MSEPTKKPDEAPQQGGPGTTQPPVGDPAVAPAAQQKVVVLNGTAYQVSDEVAANYAAQLSGVGSQYQQELARLKAENERLTKGAAPPPKKPEADDGPTPPPPSLMDTDPEEYVRRQQEYVQQVTKSAQQEVREEVAQHLVEQEQAQQAADTWQDMVDGFYDTHKDLATPAARKIVNGVYKEHFDELSKMPTTEASLKRLAELSRAELQSLRGAGDSTPNLATGGGGRGSAPRQEARTKQDEGGTMSDWIRGWREKMRAQTA